MSSSGSTHVRNSPDKELGEDKSSSHRGGGGAERPRPVPVQTPLSGLSPIVGSPLVDVSPPLQTSPIEIRTAAPDEPRYLHRDVPPASLPKAKAPSKKMKSVGTIDEVVEVSKAARAELLPFVATELPRNATLTTAFLFGLATFNFRFLFQLFPCLKRCVKPFTREMINLGGLERGLTGQACAVPASARSHGIDSPTSPLRVP